MSASSPSHEAMILIAAVIAGGISAACFGLALMMAETPLIFLAYFAAIPLFIIGLGCGHVAEVVAAFVGVAGLLITQPFNFSLIYAIINVVPVIILTGYALIHVVDAERKITYWYPEGRLLTAITLYPVVIFLVVAGMTSGHEGGLFGVTSQFINEAFEPIKGQMDADTAVKLMPVITALARLLPAVIGCSWIFITLLSMIVAQMLLQIKQWNLRPGFELRNLHIPNWLIYAAAATGLLGAAAPAPYDYIGTNLAILLGVPFFFTGLAVIHVYAELQKSPMLILLVFYLLMSVFPGLVIVAALVGAVDQWVHFRQRFVRRVDKSV